MAHGDGGSKMSCGSGVVLRSAAALDATGHALKLVEFDTKFDPGYQVGRPGRRVGHRCTGFQVRLRCRRLVERRQALGRKPGAATSAHCVLSNAEVSTEQSATCNNAAYAGPYPASAVLAYSACHMSASSCRACDCNRVRTASCATWSRTPSIWTLCCSWTGGTTTPPTTPTCGNLMRCISLH